MRSRSIILLLIILSLTAMPAMAESFTIGFTAGEIKSIMASSYYDDPLSDQNFIWGLWAIRAMPIVNGGGFGITSGSVDALGLSDFWTYAAPDPAVSWATPYGSEVAYFHLLPASEHLGIDAHPLYYIADQQAGEFQSYAFDNNVPNVFGRSTYVGVCGGMDVYGNPIAVDDPRCNKTNVLPDEAAFSFSFDLDPGASLLGWQFLVDGSKYHWGTNPYSLWIEDFIGGGEWLPDPPYGQADAGGGLTHNVGSGYQVLFPVPEPSTLILVGLGFAALCIARRHTS